MSEFCNFEFLTERCSDIIRDLVIDNESDDFICVSFNFSIEESDDDDDDDIEEPQASAVRRQSSKDGSHTGMCPAFSHHRRPTDGNIGSIDLSFGPLRRADERVENLAAYSAYEEMKSGRKRSFSACRMVFDKSTKVFLGHTSEEAVRSLTELGIDAFVRGEFEDAQRYLRSALKNSTENADEEKKYEECLNAMNLMAEAEVDWKEKHYENVVSKMQKAFECPNKKMKAAIRTRRNDHAEELANEAAKVDTAEAEKLYKLAIELCTPDNPIKHEYEVMIAALSE